MAHRAGVSSLARVISSSGRSAIGVSGDSVSHLEFKHSKVPAMSHLAATLAATSPRGTSGDTKHDTGSQPLAQNVNSLLVESLVFIIISFLSNLDFFIFCHNHS
jgi:hypothetical protein